MGLIITALVVMVTGVSFLGVWVFAGVDEYPIGSTVAASVGLVLFVAGLWIVPKNFRD